MIAKILTFATISLCITFAIAILLIISQRPSPLSDGATLDFSAANGGSPGTVQNWAPTDRPDLAMTFRRFGQGSQVTVVLVHGSGWHGGGLYAQLGEALAKQNPNVTILVPDLPGHGPTPVKRGDVDYIGQMEDALDRFIADQRTPGPLTMIGHSSGG